MFINLFLKIEEQTFDSSMHLFQTNYLQIFTHTHTHTLFSYRSNCAVVQYIKRMKANKNKKDGKKTVKF